MPKTKIEWTDYSINPVKGYCPTACYYCYARAMYDRFGWDKAIRFHPDVFDNLPKKPSRIFVGSTMELFGEWVDIEWMIYILGEIKKYPQHTFQFLTKQPGNLAKWDWPDNAWVGATATDYKTFVDACGELGALQPLHYSPALFKAFVFPSKFTFCNISVRA